MFFEYPKLLFLLAIPVLLLALYIFRQVSGRVAHVRVSSVLPFKSSPVLGVLRHLPAALYAAAVSLVIVAIARPRSSEEISKIDTEGIDIIFAMDVSTSMLAMDFTPDRISAAKDIAIEFIAQRPTDRMGIVVFAGESYTQCPLTTDRATLINLMKEIETGLIEDGTAIGNGLALAVSRLKDSDAKSRVVVLLTDGVNNRGEITPAMAAEIAKTYGIRVYTIGVGAEGEAPYPVMTPWGVRTQNVQVEIDEALLKDIASQTGGQYFRATDNTKLASIYSEINKMEKSRTTVDSFPVYTELYGRYVLAALICFLTALVVACFTKSLPLL